MVLSSVSAPATGEHRPHGSDGQRGGQQAAEGRRSGLCDEDGGQQPDSEALVDDGHRDRQRVDEVAHVSTGTDHTERIEQLEERVWRMFMCVVFVVVVVIVVAMEVRFRTASIMVVGV